MSCIDEAEIQDAFKRRMQRVRTDDGYHTDAGLHVHTDRIRFSPDTDATPFIAIVFSNGDFSSEGASHQYYNQLGHVQLLGAIKAGFEEHTSPILLLRDMKRAAFAPLEGDAISRAIYAEPISWNILLADQGEEFTQVNLTVAVYWCDETVEHER